jgi:pimeloyl-ACP methyl ester carboxylesterase
MSRPTGPVRPFPVPVDSDALDDLRRRLDHVRWPDALDPPLDGTGWEHGTSIAYMRELVAYWRTEFDWAAQAARLDRQLPSSIVEVDGLDVQFAVVPGAGPDPFPLLLMHGWPGSYTEMAELAARLSDPAAFGGDGADSFDVIVPSLPGHGFSAASPSPTFGADACSDVMRTLMVDVLGYERFGAQGGDRGAFVCGSLGSAHADVVAGIHVNFPGGVAADPPTAADRAWLDGQMAYMVDEGGYIAIQGTRPMTLAYGLHDSPVGLLAWIVEKWRAWSDCDGDIESRFTKDQILTNVTLYWLTNTMRSSMHYYRAQRLSPPAHMRAERIECPTGVASFPGEVIHVPRSAAERKYDLRRWTDMPSGGHFAPLEEPAGLAVEIAAFFREVR